MALFSMFVVAAIVIGLSLALARLGLAFTLSVASQANQLRSDAVARDTIH